MASLSCGTCLALNVRTPNHCVIIIVACDFPKDERKSCSGNNSAYIATAGDSRCNPIMTTTQQDEASAL